MRQTHKGLLFCADVIEVRFKIKHGVLLGLHV